MIKNDQCFIGIKNGMCIYISNDCIAQKGFKEIQRELGMVQKYPVKIDINDNGFNTVMVEGDSHQDAIDRFLNKRNLK